MALDGIETNLIWNLKRTSLCEVESCYHKKQHELASNVFKRNSTLSFDALESFLEVLADSLFIFESEVRRLIMRFTNR